jgi:hypothetical protein
MIENRESMIAGRGIDLRSSILGFDETLRLNYDFFAAAGACCSMTFITLPG